MSEQRVRDRTKANPHARGTSNSNTRGSAEQRRKRKEYLLEAYASNHRMIAVTWAVTGETTVEAYVITVDQLLGYDGVESAEEVPTARCFRCGALLWYGTISVDKIIPACKGGSYRRTNIRPACDDCQTTTGNEIKVAVRKNRPKS